MIPISEIYDDVSLDNVNSAENGNLSLRMFSRISRRAELRMLDYISGDIENLKPPIPYTSSKVKSWLAPFIKKFPAQVTKGIITRPTDFYDYEDMYRLGGSGEVDCDTDVVVDGCNGTIELLDPGQFNTRCKTFVEDLKPSFEKPIAKAVGRTFEFLPADLGSITLLYKRLPVFGKIVIKQDTQYNQEVIDAVKSTPYEWDESARELLVFFITDTFSIHTREQALKQFNTATGKSVRDTK